MIGFDRQRWEHDLKILPEFFEPVLRGLKKFEIRRDDRGFREGDVLVLKEWDGKRFTGRILHQQVTYLTDYGQKDGFVVMSLGLWLAFRQRP